MLIGLLVPGLSQLLFVRAVRDIGPARAAILIGTAPLMSVLIALTALGEPFQAALVAGSLLIVGGGVVLTRERVRPRDFKALGAGFALTCAGLFAVRDNLVRWVARDQHPPPLLATATSLLGARPSWSSTSSWSDVRTCRAGCGQPRARSRLPASRLPCAYVCLLEAFSHGRVASSPR